jgi:hypothetical protein
VHFRFLLLAALCSASCDDAPPKDRFPPKDRDAPQVVARCPEANRSLDDCAGSTASVEFSEPMDEASLVDAIRLLDGGTPVRGRIAYETRYDDFGHAAGAVVRIVPIDLLQPGRTYGASVDRARDLAGNEVSVPPWTFSSGGGADLVASSPFDGETGVGKRPRIHLFFDAPLRADLDTGALQLAPAGGAAVTAAFTWLAHYDAVRVETAAALAPDTEYELRVAASLADAAGRALARAASAKFRTSAGADATAPGAPGALAAAPQAGGGFKLTWTAASDETTAAAGLRYRIYLSALADPDAPLAFAETAPGKDEYTALAGAGAWAVVRAVDGSGNEGPPAGPVELKP